MVINKIDGAFYSVHMSFDDLEFIVRAANIAGYLEAEEKIYVESDTHLTEFILDKFADWYNEDNAKLSVFHEYIAKQLIDEFGYKED